MNICEGNQNKRGRNKIIQVSLPSSLVVLEDQLALVYQQDQLGPVINEEKKREQNKTFTVLYKELSG